MRSAGSKAAVGRLDLFRIFIAGTDTGVGKTEAAAALLSLLADAGGRPAPFKPYESGCSDLRRPPDALALKAAARSVDPLSRVCVHRFREPLAPGVAAWREGRRASFGPVRAAFHTFAVRNLVVEGAGGLRVPLDGRREVIDLIAALRLPVLLVARAGLGTLNHTALSLDALAARRIPAGGVLLVQGRREEDLAVEDNGAWLRARHRIEVLGPVPFEARQGPRREAFRRALAPWLATLRYTPDADAHFVAAGGGPRLGGPVDGIGRPVPRAGRSRGAVRGR